jgi:hypothetical protein
MAPYASSERDLLMLHLEKVKEGDLLLLDRGYPCFWLFFLLKARKIEFCIRLQENWWLSAKEFAKSKEKERLVTFTFPKKDREKLAGYPHMVNETITCRLVKVDLENGEKEILCTSLVDSEKYPYEEIIELYRFRWNEEEAYKLLKCRIELENFSGKTAKAVRQDFYAKVFLMTLCASFAHPIEEKVTQEYKADQNRKFDQKINRTCALSMTKNILVGLFIRKQHEKAIQSFDIIVEKTREIIRPGRKEPRKKTTKKLYSMNYKRL